MNDKFYVTTPIYYINAVPHIGHAYSTIAADILARWHRLCGEDVFFLTGLDENSVKTVESAKKKGYDNIQAYADYMATRWRKVWNILNISYDDFIRTTQDRHKRNVHDFFKKLRESGEIYKGIYEGLYCEGCEGYLTEKDLTDGKCPFHYKEPKKLKEENYFFKLSNYQDQILEHIRDNPDFIQPEYRKNEVVNLLKEGLNDVSVSRPHLEWGIKVPWDEKQTFWVWFDALINYMLPRGYWPADIHIIAKDILRFHCIIWPGMLLATGYKLPEKIFAHGFLTVKGQKISKSLGNVIDPIYLADQYSADALRYFLIREKTLGQDGDFSERELQLKLNTELADTLGNFVHRVLTFIRNNFNGKVPKGETDYKIKSKLIECIENAEELLDEVKINQALDEIMLIARIGNEYFQKSEPWKTIKEKHQEAANCMYNCINLLESLCVSLYPFIPSTCENLSNQLNIEISDWSQSKKFNIEIGHSIEKPEILFEKVEVEKEVKEKLISIDDFKELDIRIGRIKKVEDIEKSDKLLKIKIDIGGEIKQSVAGLKETHNIVDLEGLKVPVLVNLEPSELMGVKSECMLLAADSDGKPVLLKPESDVEAGVKVK